ncbi:MAG: T9SS type A sorting domain-containing protein, partial [Bacteroidota bacterium]
ASVRMDAKQKAPELIKMVDDNTKAAGDILYSFDFTVGANWTVHHNGSSDDFIIENSEPTSATTLAGVLGNIDVGPQAVYDAYYYLYNDLVPPIHDAYLEYAGTGLNFTGVPGVLLQFDFWHWPFNSDIVGIDYSTNGGTSWTTLTNDIWDGYAVNQQPDNQSTWQLNLSSVFGNQANCKFRFHYYCDDIDVNYGGGYGIIIDNVKFVEAYANEVELTKIYPNFSWINWQGSYRMIPGNILADTLSIGTFELCPMPGRIWFGAEVKNNGVVAATNVNLDVTITDGGGGGNTYYSSSTTTPIASIITDATDSLGTDSLDPFMFNDFTATATVMAIGTYDINYDITFSQTDQLPANNSDVFWFSVTDTVYGIDNNPANPASVSPGNWASGGTDGDIFGVTYDVWINNCVAKTMSVYIEGGTTFDGSGYSASIRGTLFVSDGAGGYTPIITSDIIDVDSTMVDSWITIPFILDGFSEIIPAESYCAGIEIVSYNGQDIFFGEDQQSPQAIWATMWNFVSAGQWYALSNYSNCPMIRLNLTNNSLVDVHDVNGNISALNQNYPNPFSEVTELSYSLNAASNVSIEVTDLTGKVVMVIDEGSKTAGTHFTQISSNDLTSGVYYYTLKAGDFKETRKMVVVK